jgi:hypothetical protein
MTYSDMIDILATGVLPPFTKSQRRKPHLEDPARTAVKMHSNHPF